jgi:hypothetical protein
MEGRMKRKARHGALKAGLALAAAAFLLVGRLYANSNTYYVDANHPQASDENPGSEELPWKTLSHAGETAQAGETVLIKAGTYRETLTVHNNGRLTDGRRRPERIVFQAYGNDKVIIDGSEAVPADLWQPVPGESGVYVIPLNPLLDDWGIPASHIVNAIDFDHRFLGGMDIVFWEGKPLPRNLTRDPQGVLKPGIPEANSAPSWEYVEATGKLYVHLGEADPRQEGPVEVAVRQSGILTQSRLYITLNKLTVRRSLAHAINAGYTVDAILSDCHVYHAANGIVLSGTIRPVVRRNTVHDVYGNAFYTAGDAHGGQMYDNIANRYGLARKSARQNAFINFGGDFIEYYHNIAIGTPGAGSGGYWPDMPAKGFFWVGNAAIRSGFYLERTPYNHLVQWNTVLQAPSQGIFPCASAAVVIRENLVAYSGSGIKLVDLDCHSIMFGNIFERNWFKRNRSGITATTEFRKHDQTVNYAQGNIYEVPENHGAGHWAGQTYRTLEEFRAVTGQETLGKQVAEIDLEELGLVWVRVDGWDQSHEPFPMFGNPYFERVGSLEKAQPYFGPFFWRRGDGEGTDSFPEEWVAHVGRPHVMASERGELRGGCAGYARGPRADHRGFNHWPHIASVEGTPVGRRVHRIQTIDDRAFDERGIGIWSPALPVVGGATIDISLWMKTADIKPVAEDGGAVVYVEWSDWNRQNRSRSYLVGGETAGNIVNTEYSRGSRDWSKVNGSVTAPEGARRFSLYLGMRSAQGEVKYGAVEEIRTRAGEPPEVVEVAEDKPLLNPEKLEFRIVDLAAFVNRALADEVADDGQGGWTDQGPGYDMAGLETGLREHEGIPYKILAPQSCIVLNAQPRQQSKLPEAVTIPVGEKADVLYFLHSVAWGGGFHRFWSYHLDYEDGTSFEIPIIGGAHIRDWTRAGDPYDFFRSEELRVAVWPEFVAGALSPAGGLYILEHLNSNPDRRIENIRFVQSERKRQVPILLNITLGRVKE